MIIQEIININDDRYILNRIISNGENRNIDAWKELTSSDFAFVNHKNDKIYLCTLIPDAEIIEEVNNT